MTSPTTPVSGGGTRSNFYYTTPQGQTRQHASYDPATAAAEQKYRNHNDPYSQGGNGTRSQPILYPDPSHRPPSPDGPRVIGNG